MARKRTARKRLPLLLRVMAIIGAAIFGIAIGIAIAAFRSH
jgi:hypothetical protein